MIDTIRRRIRDEEGFTLIELMVVVLIIAILIAIAIPTFLGAQNRARDRGTQSDLRNALTAAKTLSTDSAGVFQVGGADISATDMEAAEPSLTYGAVAAASTTVVGVLVEGGGASIVLEKQSASGTWFGISADSSGNVEYCRGAAPGDCDAAADAAFVPTAW
jgi:type IV pilus assembly protein PilA